MTDDISVKNDPNLNALAPRSAPSNLRRPTALKSWADACDDEDTEEEQMEGRAKGEGQQEQQPGAPANEETLELKSGTSPLRVSMVNSV